VGRKQKIREARKVFRGHEKSTGSHPKVEITVAQIEALLDRLEKRALIDADYPLIVELIKNFTWIQGILSQKEGTLERLKKLLFDPNKTEKVTRSGTSPEEDPDKKKRRTGGGGRKKPEEWATQFLVCPHSHESLKTGDLCPKCALGHLYAFEPSIHIRVRANSLFEVERHEFERLRCSACSFVFSARWSEELRNEPDATAEAVATAVLLRYQSGLPQYRLLNFLKVQGVFLTWTKLWGWVVGLFEVIIFVYEALKKIAANGKLVQNDDTRMKVLSLVKENRLNPELKRVGMQTSAIVAYGQNGEKINLFMTGRKHCGENLKDLLDRRTLDESILHMSDASAQTAPQSHEIKSGSCNDHFRRKFYKKGMTEEDYGWYVIERLAVVYQTDELAKKLQLDDEGRMKLHQANSTQPIEEIFQWLQAEKKMIEPNSEDGKNIAYGLNHWTKLIAFLSIPGMPVSNAVTERLIKTAVLHRKNSYFYKTLFGAKVGDVMMSVIQTAADAGQNVIQYLVAMQRHAKDVKEHPDQWVPWAYTQRLTHLNS
jgi:transposase